MSKLSKNDLIPVHSTWTRAEKGFMVKYGPQRDSSMFVSNAELSQLYEMLPEAIPMLPGDITGMEIRILLALWDANLHVLTSDQRYIAVHGLNRFEVCEHIVQCSGYGIYYEERLLHNMDTVVRFPVGRTGEFDIEKSWLDAQYPGWEARLDIALSLDIPVKQAFTQALAATSVTITAEMPTDMVM